MSFRPFAMERWQSTWENRVAYNLSESGVHPVSVAELLGLAGGSSIDDVLLGYGQSNGSDVLRERIAALYTGASEANVMVTNGSAEANFVAIWQLVEPGDEVAVVMPAYMQTPGLVEAFGGTVRKIRLHPDHAWQPDPDEIRRAITDRTRLVVVTNPNNPTGAVLGEEARVALIEATGRTGTWLLADEVYTGAERSGPETPSFFGAHPRVLATGSMSKAYGMPGLRIGWVVADPAVAEQLWARTDYTTISAGDLTDTLASLALRTDVRPRLIERTRGYIERGLAVLEEWMAAQGGFDHRAPDAGAICFARYAAPIPSDVLAERLRVERSLLIVPGEHFGFERHLRFGFGMETDRLEAALERLGEQLATAATTAAH
ncbi:MAG: aminotransferase class I/II-fold pyridoxal phosphate-dependent enzyme [Longimicrobiales bacterium]